MAFFVGFELGNDIFVSISAPNRKASFFANKMMIWTLESEITCKKRDKKTDDGNIGNCDNK
ncbi:hypothetical protein BWI96_14610 [Siphonobacter sp. SORGH_AS_0500]|nr:hypothetical protein BWI96_14055 [Siphonobacter sp. SORGH_AS_0500]PKK35966.1 hypothetical protein BWI96_14610 [Siphonobacter sp. SORGH_AS_0500]